MIFKRLKHCVLPYFSSDAIWTICPYTGSLLKNEITPKTPQKIPHKVSEALRYCNNPYIINPDIEDDDSPIDPKFFNGLHKMHERFLKIDNSRFYLNRMYANLKHELFGLTSTAMVHINNIPEQQKNKHRLCLQRVFLASKVSQSFAENGVIFIGAFLPTGDMHTWIIENGTQPDREDRGWINYRPLIALYN